MQIAHVFFDIHMGMAFTGLNEICKKAKVESTNSKYVVFINKKRDKFKLLISDKYLVYHDNKNQPISLDALKHLPQAFVGDKFDFSRSVETSIRERFLPSGAKR